MAVKTGMGKINMDNIDEETLDDSTNEPALPYFWVGLGASAGGLEALTHCVAHLPLKSGCVYIIAQHMSPNHRSLMAEILGRGSRITGSRSHVDSFTATGSYLHHPTRPEFDLA